MAKIKILILTAILILGIVGTSSALTMRYTPGQPSSFIWRDGGTTPKDWCTWVDSTNSVMKISSGADNGGAKCPWETGFDETDGQILGSQS